MSHSTPLSTHDVVVRIASARTSRPTWRLPAEHDALAILRGIPSAMTWHMRSRAFQITPALALLFIHSFIHSFIHEACMDQQGNTKSEQQ